jgi:hypothetical protein
MSHYLTIAQVLRKLRELGLCADEGTVREIYYRDLSQGEGGE